MFKSGEWETKFLAFLYRKGYKKKQACGDEEGNRIDETKGEVAS